MNGFISRIRGIVVLTALAVGGGATFAQDGYGPKCCEEPSWVSAACDAAPCDSTSVATESCDAAAFGCDGIGPCGSEFQALGCSGCLSQPVLTGDWCGLRSHLKESGIQFRGTSTHFAFGVEGGINVPVAAPFGQGDTFKYTGRGEYDWIFDLEKFGGLPKGKLVIGIQHWYGEFGNVSVNTGTFAPPVFAAALPPTPDDPGTPYVTDFLFTQPLSEGLIVFAGKKNVIGAADQTQFAGGDGTNQFMNQALIANPAFLLGLPYSSFSAGVVMPREWGLSTLFVFDPQDRTRDFFRLEDLFSEGIIVGGQVTVNTNFLCKPGEQHVGFLWKHLDQTDLRFQQPAPEYPYPTVPGFPTRDDAYTLYYGFDQYLGVFPGKRPGIGPNKKPRGWGLFGRASISDANPTPVEYFLSLGIGGDNRVGGDRGDTWGLGWFFVGASDEFGATPEALFGPRDGTGVELYYNVQATPWLNITPDVQFVRPGLGRLTSDDDAFVYGIRVSARL